jgi:aspartate 1-decarboxylase
VLNLNNGVRFETYIIEGEAGRGEVVLNGPAARCGEVGDAVIVAAFGAYDESEAHRLQPVIVHVDERNRPREQ